MSNKATEDLRASVEHNEELKREVLGQVANHEEHGETAIHALRKHPVALAWCAYALGVLILSSYDNQAGGIFLSIPEFRKDFGYYYDGNYVLPAKWQSAYSGGPTASSVSPYRAQ